MFRRSSCAAATSREGHRSPRSDRAVPHRRWGRGPSSIGGIINLIDLLVHAKDLLIQAKVRVVLRALVLKRRCDLRVNEYTAYSRRQLLANAAIAASRVSA
jgi:hypothetical protein